MSWRVAVTRDEPAGGPLSAALRAASLVPVSCPVVDERPAADPEPLRAAAATLESFDWAIFSSRRAVHALARARGRAWPATLNTAAVGANTAKALQEAGATSPLIADEAGADALWQILKDRDWKGVRVLLPVVADGRRTVIDGLNAAGAIVTVVEAYRMTPRPALDIARDWTAAAPDAVVIASPAAATSLIDSIGRDTCATLAAIVAIGPTTAEAIKARGLDVLTSPAADFVATARFVADLSRRHAGTITHADG